MLSHVELALAIVGLVIVYHNGPEFLIPNVRPFTCGFCLSLWIVSLYLLVLILRGSIGWWQAVVLFGETAAVAGVMVSAFPELFYRERV